MRKHALPFVLVGLLGAALASLSIVLSLRGYAFGAHGLGVLSDLFDPAIFLPLAALYAFASALIVILPIRAAGAIHLNGAVPLFSTAQALLGAMIGLQLARFAFGDTNALGPLLDWRLLPGIAIVVVHLSMNELRANMVLRVLCCATFLAATLACLYWNFPA